MFMELREMELREEGRAEGREEGRVEGHTEGRMEMITNAINNGASDEEIMRFMSVSREDLEMAHSLIASPSE